MMKNATIYTALVAAITLTTASADVEKEKCKVVKDGKGLIKEGKGQCETSQYSCAGHNKAGDPEAWIYVPKGQCDKINLGDFSGVSPDIKEKIEGAH